ncbi:hypothetical protein [Mesorhizobium sp. GR13]|uniref:hypothetical protein n=1 Tax=Mesorhizobium sp. GR13 TaxID=2562308 RepID=UPI0010C0A6CB|nr:hypothetical protein [Mesorhizobium sp. GR13]
MAEPAKATDGEALRLNWRQTWPETEADYFAVADGYDEAVGRIFKGTGGQMKGLWFWSMTANGPEISRNIGELCGTALSARGAARLVEDVWFDAIRGTSLDRPAPHRNGYAAAKAR